MEIMIVGSMTFAKEMLKVQSDLTGLGHTAYVPCDADLHADLEHIMEQNVLRRCFDMVAESDAILVLNYAKNGIDGYIGTSTGMETAIAYQHRNKIFLYNELPDSKDHRWAHEIKAMQPTILYQDLTNIY